MGAYYLAVRAVHPDRRGAQGPARRLRREALVYGVKGVFTNTVPVDAYRGAGRPESIY